MCAPEERLELFEASQKVHKNNFGNTFLCFAVYTEKSISVILQHDAVVEGSKFVNN
jgi:hypothetical protein